MNVIGDIYWHISPTWSCDKFISTHSSSGYPWQVARRVFTRHPRRAVTNHRRPVHVSQSVAWPEATIGMERAAPSAESSAQASRAVRPTTSLVPLSERAVPGFSWNWVRIAERSPHDYAIRLVYRFPGGGQLQRSPVQEATDPAAPQPGQGSSSPR